MNKILPNNQNNLKGMTLTGVSAIATIYGNAIAGGIIGVGTLASLVGVFMYGSKMRSEERKGKISKEE